MFVSFIILLILCSLCKACAHCVCECGVQGERNENQSTNLTSQLRPLSADDEINEELPSYDDALKIDEKTEEHCYEFHVSLEDSIDDLTPVTVTKIKHPPPSYDLESSNTVENATHSGL